MEMSRHQGNALRYVALRPDGFNPQVSYPLIVLLHGFGSNMHDLAALAPAIDPRGYVYLCPNAPLSIPIGPGLTGFAWTPLAQDKTSSYVAAAEEALMSFLEEASKEYGLPPGKMLLGGFSQGGMMTYQVGLPRPDLLAGLVALSGRIDDAQSLEERLPSERNQPVFIAHGTQDPLINVEQAREAKNFLEAQGYRPHYHEYPMAHQITQEVLQDLVPWIHLTLPPASTEQL